MKRIRHLSSPSGIILVDRAGCPQIFNLHTRRCRARRSRISPAHTQRRDIITRPRSIQIRHVINQHHSLRSPIFEYRVPRCNLRVSRLPVRAAEVQVEVRDARLPGGAECLSDEESGIECGTNGPLAESGLIGGGGGEGLRICR